MDKASLIEALKSQRLVSGQTDLAEHLASCCTVENVPSGTVVMEEDDAGSDLLLILQGNFSVMVGGSRVSTLEAGNHVGEMAVVDPDSNRSATVVASEDSVVARLTDSNFESVANTYPLLWKNLTLELANRLRQTNRWMSQWEPKAEILKPEEE